MVDHGFDFMAFRCCIEISEGWKSCLARSLSGGKPWTWMACCDMGFRLRGMDVDGGSSAGALSSALQTDGLPLNCYQKQWT